MHPSVPPPLPVHVQQGSVAAAVRALPPGARLSEVWRGAVLAILRLNVHECEALGAVFEDERAADDLRLLVLDLLAGAGTFEAQVVMRRLLSLAVARRDSRTFATFVQRLGFVEQPDGPTLRFLMSVYGESRREAHDVRAACAYALGAAAGQARAAGDGDVAVRASDVLRRDLLDAASAVERRALLTALGNTGVDADVAIVGRFVSDADPGVRAAAALALRKIAAPEARSMLLAALVDRDARVAQSALVALSEQQLDGDEIDRLAELVLSGRTPRGLDERLLRLVVAQRARLAPKAGRAAVVEDALRLLLGRVEAQQGLPERVGSGERAAAWPSGVALARQRLADIGLDPDGRGSSIPAPPAVTLAAAGVRPAGRPARPPSDLAMTVFKPRG